MIKYMVYFSFLLLSLSSLNAQELDGKIAVLQLVNKAKLDGDEMSYLTTQIQEKIQVKTKGKYQVMTQENILTLLPPDKKLEDCAASECEVDTGRLLGAALIVTGQVVKFGTQKELRCTIKLHETKTGTLLSSQTIKAKNIEGIEVQLLDMIDKLLKEGLGGTEETSHISNATETAVNTKAGNVNLDDEIKNLEEYHALVKKDWDKIKVLGQTKDQSKASIAIKAIELFLKKYESHALGNPFQGEANQLLMELQGNGNQGQKQLNEQENESINWILIKGGKFKMGGEAGELTELPVHTVNIKNFYISKTEVTVGQYQKCTEAGACSEPHWNDESCGMWNGVGWKQGNVGNEFRGENQPVVCVDWHQARAFAKWVGGDLPSETQWEYAARARGQGIEYPWGDLKPTCDIVNFNYSCHKKTIEVCSKTEGNTAQGLCDMGGNVREWVLDEYHHSYDGAPTDSSGWCSDRGCSFNTSAVRVVRSGGWSDNASRLRSASRHHNLSSDRYANIGFRVFKASK